MKRLIVVLFSCFLIFSTVIYASAANCYTYDLSTLNTDVVICNVTMKAVNQSYYYILYYTSEGNVKLVYADNDRSPEVSGYIKAASVDVNDASLITVSTNKKSLSIAVDSGKITNLIEVANNDEETIISLGSILESYIDGVEVTASGAPETTGEVLTQAGTTSSVEQTTQSAESAQVLGASDDKKNDYIDGASYKVPFIISVIFNILLSVAVVILLVMANKKKKHNEKQGSKKNNKKTSPSITEVSSKEKTEVGNRSVYQPQITTQEHIDKEAVPGCPIPESVKSVNTQPVVARSWMDSVKPSILESYRNGESFNFEHFYANIDDYLTNMSGEVTVKVYDKTSTHFVLFNDRDSGKMYLLPNPCYYNCVNRRFSLTGKTFNNIIVPTNNESGTIVDFKPTSVEETYRNCYSVKIKGTIFWG